MNTAKKLSIRLEAVGGDKVRQEFKNIGSDGQKAFQRITQVITPANDNLKILDNTAKAFNNTLKQAASLAGAYLGLRGLTNTFKSIVETNKEFERLSGSLKTVTGSAKAAKEAFTLIEDFATSTPFQLDEIVDSFIRLKAMGLEPSMEALISYGNTASAFGKNILEFVSAVTSATVGEFERLKTFGIKAKVEGELVKFIFQGITTEVGKNAVEIENYLRSIGTINFGGAMAEQMNTMGGTMSNIEDALAKVARTIGENGLNKAIKEVLDQFNNLISGTDGAAKTIGETLASAVTIAGKAFFTLAKYIEPIITLLTVRLGASLITKGIDLLKASVYALNVALMGTGTAGASATLGLKMMWQVSKVAAVQMYATAVAAKVLAGAVGLLKGIMALLGGPAGLVMLVVYGLYKLIDSHNVAKRAANDHADTLSLKAVSPSVFENAPRFHTGGLVGGEIPIIAKKGETVFTPGQMKALGAELNSKPPVYVNVNVVNKASGTRTTANPTRDMNGNVNLDIIVEQIEGAIGKNISKGEGLSPILEQRYALNPAYGSYR